MKRQQDIEFLETFRQKVKDYLFLGYAPADSEGLRMMREKLENPDFQQLRREINEMKRRADQLLSEFSIHTIVVQYPAPAIGGPILEFNLLDLITENRSPRNLDVETVIDKIDQAIGILKYQSLPSIKTLEPSNTTFQKEQTDTTTTAKEPTIMQNTTTFRSPQDEAINILKVLRDNLLAGKVDLKNALRNCSHICQLLGWIDKAKFFGNELNGYPSGSQLPQYRKDIQAKIRWRTIAEASYPKKGSYVEDRIQKIRRTENSVLRESIDQILSFAEHSASENTGKLEWKNIGHTNVEVEKVLQRDKEIFQTLLRSIEHEVFNFVSQSWTLLCYSSMPYDVFQDYRTAVDKRLYEIGLGKHLDSIVSGLRSDNPQDWRNAMWSCRDIIRDLAGYLWRDLRDTYDYLPGKGKNGKLEVTENKYVNRLGAYLHQKTITAENRQYLTAEIDRIYSSIDTLNDLASKAHSPVSLTDAKTVVIGTYIILGELVIRTDLIPITEYH